MVLASNISITKKSRLEVRFSGSIPDLLNQNLWDQGLGKCICTSPLVDSHAQPSMRTTGKPLFNAQYLPLQQCPTGFFDVSKAQQKSLYD